MGPVLVLLSATCFGAMAIFGKLAYDAGVSSQTLVLLRFTLAALLLLGVSAARGRSAGTAGAPSARLTPRLVLTALLLGAVGYATQASLYFAAL